ncbi:MAG: hypothetical protein ACK4FZ_14200 [Vogesella sp.]|uniref:hypothetical protein n=1 Tax=Vogesella sp. TaxID=1904252 RepID=UPI00391C5C99
MSVSTPAEPITVLTAGMDERKLALFRMAFRLHTLYPYRLASDHGGTPQLAIIDVDSATGWQVWQQYRQQHPALPALIVTAYPSDDAPALQMVKPVRMEKLFPLLRQLLATPAAAADSAALPPASPQPAVTPEPAAALLAATPASQPAPGPVPPPAAVRPTRPPPGEAPPLARHGGQRRILQRFHTAGTIYGLLLDAARQKQPQRLYCEQRLLASVDPLAGQVQLYAPLSSLQQLAELDGLRLACQLQTEPLPPPVLHMGLTTLLWQVALWSCRGRLLAGIDPDTPLRLRQWPNLTRLAPLDGALRIAGLWSRTPTSLRVAVSLLRMEPAVLCNFIAASHALGLLEQVGKRSEAAPSATRPATPAPAPLPPARQSLLSRLLGRIKNL